MLTFLFLYPTKKGDNNYGDMLYGFTSYCNFAFVASTDRHHSRKIVHRREIASGRKLCAWCVLGCNSGFSGVPMVVKQY